MSKINTTTQVLTLTISKHKSKEKYKPKYDTLLLTIFQ